MFNLKKNVMKKQKKSFILLFSLGIFCSSIFAQTTFYVVNGGSSTAFTLKNARKIVISSNDMTVVNNDATQSVFSYENMNYLSFVMPSIATGLPDNIIDFSSQIKVYPTIVKDVININFACNRKSVVSIINISGQIVAKQNFQGENIVSINLSRLTRGMYVCKVQQEGKTTSVKIIKE